MFTFSGLEGGTWLLGCCRVFASSPLGCCGLKVDFGVRMELRAYLKLLLYCCRVCRCFSPRRREEFTACRVEVLLGFIRFLSGVCAGIMAHSPVFLFQIYLVYDDDYLGITVFGNSGKSFC